MSELCGFVYNKGHQKSRETTREIWRSEGEFILATLDKIAYLESNAPAPGSSVLVSSKESLISEHL